MYTSHDAVVSYREYTGDATHSEIIAHANEYPPTELVASVTKERKARSVLVSLIKQLRFDHSLRISINSTKHRTCD